MSSGLRFAILLISAVLGTEALWANSARSAEARVVTVWIYHQFPPFITDAASGSGFSFDLARQLGKTSDRRYKFRVEAVTRERLNHLLAEANEGLVLWANPAWFGDHQKQRYAWSDPLFLDHNDVISPRAAPIDYDGPASLKALKLAGVRGHRYPEIDALLEADQITREDVATEEHAVMFIAHARADVAIIASSAARYYAKRPDIEGRIHFSPNVFSSYSRSILMQTDDDALVVYVRTAIRQLKTHQDWQRMLTRHGFDAD